MNLVPHLTTPVFAVRDGLIWLVLTVVTGAHTARDLLQGRLGDEPDPPVRHDRDGD